MSERDELREHSFDGIQEYDNDLPRWWLALFLITIGFAIAYPFIYDFGPGQFASETVDMEVKEALALQAAASAQSTAQNVLSLEDKFKDKSVIAEGGQIYQTRCLACHGPQGQGLIGPNLTDEFWIHGGTPDEIVKVIENGVLDKGMLAWKGQLTQSQIHAVAAYTWSIYGTNPPNPKPAQGNKVVRQ